LSSPTLSVVVPVYNAASVLARTVPAMLAQERAADWTFVDDGSTDSSADLLRELLQQGPAAEGATARLVCHASNAGRAAARNTGRAYAKGNVIVFLDCDMEPAPTFLDAHARVYADPAVVGAVSPERWADLDPSDPYHFYLKHHPRGAAQFGAGVPVPFKPFIIGYTSIRRDALDAVGGFDEGVPYGEDIELAYRLAARYPKGLRLAPDAVVLQHGAPTLEEALAKWERFGHTSVPLLMERHPGLARVIGADLAQEDSLRGLLGAILLHRPGARSVRRLLPHLPGALRTYAVRYLVAAALVTGVREGASTHEAALAAG